MSEKSRRRKKRIRLKGIIRLFVIVTVVILVIYLLIKGNFSKEEVSYALSYDEINVRDNYRALILRNEHILKSSSSGTVVQVAADGERVKRNQRIMDISKDDTIQVMSVEGMVKQSSVEIKKYNIEQVASEIEVLKADISEKIHSRSYDDIKLLSMELEAKIQRRLLMEEGISDDTYNESEVGTGELAIGESAPIQTPLSGILTYFIDGYETELTFANVINLALDDVMALDILPYIATQGSVQQGDPLCKIINDDYYYLIILVDHGNQNLYDLSEDLLINVGGQTVKGYIAELIPTESKIAVAIKVESYIDGFYKNRFVDISITQETHRGLTIKTSSLVKNEQNKWGVYVIDKYKNVSFKPVKIIVHQGDTAIVKEDAFYEFVGGDNIRIDTVGFFDQVLVHGEKYQPGDVVD